MKLLDRNALLKKEELEVKKVDLGKGEFVHVRQMTGHERDQFERSIVSLKEDGSGIERKLEDFRAKLAVSTICSENGELVLKQEDASTLSKAMSAARLEKIVNVAQKLNMITEEDKEGLVKN